MTQTAVMFGAGNVGRGFLGQLFSESGYEVVFVDVDDELIRAINAAGCYPIHLVDNSGEQEIIVKPARAIHSRQAGEVSEAVSQASIAATAVGARALPYIAPLVAAGIVKRSCEGAPPLSIIICENLKDAAATFRQQVSQSIPPEEQQYFHRSVGFVDTVIGRMVPPPTAEMRARDPRLIVVEPYKELPVDRAGFVGPIPTITGMQACDNFGVYTARKLYVHNCGHAFLAYMGYLRGHEYGYEALVDPAIRPGLEKALDESIAGIVAEYRVEAGWLKQHAADLLERFSNRALGDTVFRLGRDPSRKLAPKDRLLGAARLAEKAGIVPATLAWGIAAGYCFAPQDDPLAVDLQRRITKEGIAAVLKEVSGIDASEALGALVLERYQDLKEGRMP